MLFDAAHQHIVEEMLDLARYRRPARPGDGRVFVTVFPWESRSVYVSVSW